LDVVVGGLGRNVEPSCRFLGGQTGGDETEHLDLARRQPGKRLGRAAARRLTGHGKHRLGRLRVDAPLADGAAQLRRRRFDGQRVAVRTLLPRGLEGLGGGKYAGGGR